MVTNTVVITRVLCTGLSISLTSPSDIHCNSWCYIVGKLRLFLQAPNHISVMESMPIVTIVSVCRIRQCIHGLRFRIYDFGILTTKVRFHITVIYSSDQQVHG